MKNEHLLPQVIIDLVEKVNDPNIKPNEKQNYVHRVEVIRDYCVSALEPKTFTKKK